MEKRLNIHVTSIAPRFIVDEVVNAFVVGLRKLGHEVSTAHQAARDGWINIVCFALGFDRTLLHRYPERIVLNFEPLAPGTQASGEHYLGLLRDNYVWDYSLSNLAAYPALGIRQGFHVPLGYEEEADVNLGLGDRLSEDELDIDVLFFGGPNARRQAVLDDLASRGLRVVTNGQTLWEPAYRDQMIRRAKVVLNMHRFDNVRIAEMPRLNMLLRRRKAVVCELYPDTEILPALRGAVAGAPLGEIAKRTEELVRSPQQRGELERVGLGLLATSRQTEILRPALAHYLASRQPQP